MLADPKVAEPGVAALAGAHTLIEITAADGPRPRPLARLIIGVSSSGEVSRRQQRRHAASLLEELLSLTYPKGFTAWTLARRRSGAPYLDAGDCSAPPPRISIAHAGAWAMAAVTTAASIGVDIEQQKPGRNTAQLAEFMGWQLRGDTDTEFYQRWTLWEAYTKCRKERLFAPGGPEFEALQADTVAGRDRKARTWHAFHLQVADRVQAAVVVRTSEPAATTAHSLDNLPARPW